MSYVSGFGKVHFSKEERADIARENGKLGGCPGFVPYGAPQKPKPARGRKSTLDGVSRIISMCAAYDGVSTAAFVKKLAESLSRNERYAHLFQSGAESAVVSPGQNQS